MEQQVLLIPYHTQVTTRAKPVNARSPRSTPHVSGEIMGARPETCQAAVDPGWHPDGEVLAPVVPNGGVK